jgi:hypothetical protein
VRRLLAALALGCLLAAPLDAAPRFIGPWFTDATVNTLTGLTSLTAGQNTERLGISFTCVDRRISFGVWKPRGSLKLEIARQTRLSVKVDVYDPIELVGIATQRNLAEFEQQVGLIAREMLVGAKADIVFTDTDGDETRETFPLANTQIAFAALAQSCPLN